MGAGRLAGDAGADLGGAGDLQIEEPQRALGVQPVDQVLDVGQRILRVHQARHRVFQLAPVDDHRGVHREQVVLAGVVDVQVRVHDVAHVAHAHAVALQLVLDHVLVELQAAHAQRFHDLVGAVAGIDHDRPGSAEDQEAEGRHPPRAAAAAPQHQEAAFQLDVAVVEDLDFERHGRVFLVQDPLSPLFSGERVRVRGSGNRRRRSVWLPLTSCRRHGSAMTLSPS